MNDSVEKINAILLLAERHKGHPFVVFAGTVIKNIERLNILLSEPEVASYLQENGIDPEEGIYRAEASALALISQLLDELEQPRSELENKLTSLVLLLDEQGENISLLVGEIESVALLLESRSNA